MEDGQALADHWGIPFLECSAKRNVNVSKCQPGELPSPLTRLRQWKPSHTRILPSPDRAVVPCACAMCAPVLSGAAEAFTALMKEVERDNGLLDYESPGTCTLL